MAQYPLCNVQSVKAIWYRKPWNSGLFHAGWLLLSLDAGHGNRGGAYFGIPCFSGIFWRYLHGRAPFRRNMNRKGETNVDKTLEEMDEQELSNLLVLMKAKGKNSYGYLSRPDARRCPVCGEVFETKGRGRPKKFCSEKCRTKYHHRHPNMQNWTTTRIAVCPQCGKEFTAAREYGHLRKYCSRACANRGRAAERRQHESQGTDHRSE